MSVSSETIETTNAETVEQVVAWLGANPPGAAALQRTYGFKSEAERNLRRHVSHSDMCVALRAAGYNVPLPRTAAPSAPSCRCQWAGNTLARCVPCAERIAAHEAAERQAGAERAACREAEYHRIGQDFAREMDLLDSEAAEAVEQAVAARDDQWRAWIATALNPELMKKREAAYDKRKATLRQIDADRAAARERYINEPERTEYKK